MYRRFQRYNSRGIPDRRELFEPLRYDTPPTVQNHYYIPPENNAYRQPMAADNNPVAKTQDDNTGSSSIWSSISDLFNGGTSPVYNVNYETPETNYTPLYIGLGIFGLLVAVALFSTRKQ